MTTFSDRTPLQVTKHWLAPWSLLLLFLLPSFTTKALGFTEAESPVPWTQGANSQQAPTSEIGASTGSVQIVFVRHAEKERNQGADPKLSAQGQGRAQRLAQLFQNAGAKYFFASQFRRTQDTLAPWAKTVGSEIEVVKAQDPEQLIQLLRDLPPGSLAAVAGHSNTIPDLIQRLGGSIAGLNDQGWLPDSEYSRLFVLTIPVGDREEDSQAECPTSLLELNF